MFKRTISAFLILIILLSNFTRFAVFLTYQLNKKHISLTLCENREKPWLKCFGKCFYKKTIRIIETDPKNQSKNFIKSGLELSYFQSINKFSLEVFSWSHPSISSHYLDFYDFKHPHSIFQPPQNV